MKMVAGMGSGVNDCALVGASLAVFTESTDQDTMKQFAKTAQLIPMEWAAA